MCQELRHLLLRHFLSNGFAREVRWLSTDEETGHTVVERVTPVPPASRLRPPLGFPGVSEPMSQGSASQPSIHCLLIGCLLCCGSGYMTETLSLLTWAVRFSGERQLAKEAEGGSLSEG